MCVPLTALVWQSSGKCEDVQTCGFEGQIRLRLTAKQAQTSSVKTDKNVKQARTNAAQRIRYQRDVQPRPAVGILGKLDGIRF